MKTAIHGLLVLDKPAGLTSRAALDRARRWFPRGTRVGHTGTLDPLATGVLVLCLGAATRLAEYVQAMPKTYVAGLLLGARSDTDDADGTVTPVPGARAPDRAEVEEALRGLVGVLAQVPPAYSAAHVGGRRAYDLARRGRAVALAPRRVEVYSLDLLSYNYPRLLLEVRCGKGTYVRSLARDLGDRLGCGALVETLRRTRVGPFDVADAVPLDADADTARRAVRPPDEAVAGLPRVPLDERTVGRLRAGGLLPLADPALRGLALPPDGEVAVFGPDGRLALVAAVEAGPRRLKPSKVLTA